ncbi:hypothetical protein KBC04_05025 [Candidatus Babeliales bacterium]|nr:hypothetical protein [Candidatus Babeliales bacterium]MBP9844246.1 hypothetical protein [Candidatus Babeliales bacterium]
MKKIFILFLLINLTGITISMMNPSHPLLSLNPTPAQGIYPTRYFSYNYIFTNTTKKKIYIRIETWLLPVNGSPGFNYNSQIIEIDPNQSSAINQENIPSADAILTGRYALSTSQSTKFDNNKNIQWSYLKINNQRTETSINPQTSVKIVQKKGKLRFQ